MGHYSYFCGCTSNEAAFPNGRGDEPLLEAKYYVPIFWLAAFDVTDLLVGEIEGERYASLCCPAVAGLERLRRRRDAILEVVGERFRVLYDEWIEFITANYSHRLLMKVDDLFAMTDFDSAAERLRENIEALAPADRGEPLLDLDALQRFTYIKGVDDGSKETLLDAARRSRAIFAGWAYGDEEWPRMPTYEEIAWIDKHTPIDWRKRSANEIMAHLRDLLVAQVARTWAEAISPLALYILASRNDTAAIHRITAHLSKDASATILAWLEPEPREPGQKRELAKSCYGPCTDFGGVEYEVKLIADGFIAGREGEAAVNELFEEMAPECLLHPAMVLLGATWGRGSPRADWREKLAAPQQSEIDNAYQEGLLSPLARTAFQLARDVAGKYGGAAEDTFLAEEMRNAYHAASSYVDQIEQKLDGSRRDDEAAQRAVEKLDELVGKARSGGLSKKDGLAKIARQARLLHDAGGANDMVRIVASLEEIWGPLKALLAFTNSRQDQSAALDILSSTPSRATETAEVVLIQSARTSSRARGIAALARDGDVDDIWYRLGCLFHEEELDAEALLCLMPIVRLAPETFPPLREGLNAELAKISVPITSTEPHEVA